MPISISGVRIGMSDKPFVIAEMSGNHNQSLERAFAIVDAAADAGAHAVKLQTYTADTMTLPVSEGEFFINDEKSLWKGNSLHDLYKRAYTPWEWHAPIMERARERGMVVLQHARSTRRRSTSSRRSKLRPTRSPRSRTCICRSSERLPPPASR